MRVLNIFSLACLVVSNVIRRSQHCVKSVRIEENTDQKKLRIWTLLTQCWELLITLLTTRHTNEKMFNTLYFAHIRD